MHESKMSEVATDVNMVTTIYSILVNAGTLLLRKCEKRRIRKAARILNKSDIHDAYFVSLLEKEERYKLESLLRGSNV